MAECFRKLGELQKALETLEVTTTASADKHYQMGMVFLSLDGQQNLAQVNLTKALFEYHNGKTGKDQRFEVFMKLTRLEMLAVITSANPKAANCLMALGDSYRHCGDHANARAYLKKAFEVLAESYGDEAVVPVTGHYLQHSGVIYSDCEDHARAKDYFIQSLSVYKKAFGNDSHHIYIANAEAEAHYRDSLTMYREVFGIDGEPENVARILHRLGDVLVRKGEIYEAEGCFSRSLDILDKLGKLSPCEMASRWKDIGLKWKSVERGKPLLIKYLTSSLSLYDDLPPDEDTMKTKASVLTELAMVHCSNGELDKGKLYAQRAFAITETELADAEAGLIAGEKEADLLIQMGKLKILTNEKVEATCHYSKAVDHYKTCLQSNNHENLNSIISLLAQLAELYDELDFCIERDETALMPLKLRYQFEYWQNVTFDEMMRAFKINNHQLFSCLKSSPDFPPALLTNILIMYKNFASCNIAKELPQTLVRFVDEHQKQVPFQLGKLLYQQAIKTYTAAHQSFDGFINSSLRNYLIYCHSYKSLIKSDDFFIQNILGQFHNQPNEELMVAWRSSAAYWIKLNKNQTAILYLERALVISSKLNLTSSRILLAVAAIHQDMAKIFELSENENYRAVRHYDSALQQCSTLSKQRNAGLYCYPNMIGNVAKASPSQ